MWGLPPLYEQDFQRPKGLLPPPTFDSQHGTSWSKSEFIHQTSFFYSYIMITDTSLHPISCLILKMVVSQCRRHGIFHPPALTLCFSDLCPQLENMFSLLDCLASSPSGLSRSLEQAPSHSNISAVAQLKVLNKSGCFPGLNPADWGPPPNPHIVNGNKEKERTVKSGRNSVYGAPQPSCPLELPMKSCHGQSCDLLELQWCLPDGWCSSIDRTYG